jgi:hypothetical protein
MWLNTFISAVIAIISFALSVFPGHLPSGHLPYFEVPMSIIGKVYVNSMLALINSRIVLGSEETQTPLTVISVVRFRTAPAHPEESAIEADNGDLAVDTRAGGGPSGCSELEAV